MWFLQHPKQKISGVKNNFAEEALQQLLGYTNTDKTQSTVLMKQMALVPCYTLLTTATAPSLRKVSNQAARESNYGASQLETIA